MRMHRCDIRWLDFEQSEINIVALVTMTQAEYVQLYGRPDGLAEFVVFLNENVGSPRYDWFLIYDRTGESDIEIQFVRENDALLFLLRYSGADHAASSR
jgi:hypothetical protein